MKEFRPGYSGRMLQEVADAIGGNYRLHLTQEPLSWKVVVFGEDGIGETAYINEDPLCCVAFLEGMKWIMDHSDDVKSAQLRMDESMKKYLEENYGKEQLL